MRLTLIFFLLFSSAKAQFTNWINVRLPPFSSPTGNTLNASTAIQAAIDSAVEVNGVVYIPHGIYRLDTPLVVYKWDGTNYQDVSIKIIGDDAMWSTGATRLYPSFKDRFGIGIQRGKGVFIDGILLEGDYTTIFNPLDSMMKSPMSYRGDTTCRNTRYSPFAGVVIDPFSYNVPPDGGYPGMTSWYRGEPNTNGSSFVRIENSSFVNFTVNAVISPNGVTKNGDNIQFKNIRARGGLIGFSGSQEGEKNNKVINIGMWGFYRFGFRWGVYGEQKQGHWIVSEFNLAQGVVDFINRDSRYSGYPLFVEDGFSESLGRYGTWYGTVDAFFNNTLGLTQRISTDTKGYASPGMAGKSVALFNAHLRYYGMYGDPMSIANDVSEFYNIKQQNIYPNPLIGQYLSSTSRWRYSYGYTLADSITTTVNWYDSVGRRYARITTPDTWDVNDQVFFATTDYAYVGSGIVTKEVQSDYYIIGNLSPYIPNATELKVFKYAISVLPRWRPNGVPGD